MSPRHLLLHGQFSPDLPPDAVPRWLRLLRQDCAHLPLRGGLLFDGESWLLLLQGPAAAVTQLQQGLVAMGMLEVQALVDFEAASPQLEAVWAVGYVDPSQLLSLQARCVAAAGDGAAASAAFMTALREADAS